MTYIITMNKQKKDTLQKGKWIVGGVQDFLGLSDEELKIIEGGPGNRYLTSGTFESSIFDAGQTVAFNRFDFTKSTPSQTTLSVQIAVADAVSGSCDGANFNFVGPDETSSSYFLSGGQIPLVDNGLGFINPGRCFRYKAYLDTEEKTQTPVLNDLRVNYSP